MLPYEQLQEDLIFRDFLAIDRTRLANERTLLGYIRTCLGALATGAGLVKFGNAPAYNITGYVLFALCPVILGLGLWRYYTLRGRLRRLESPSKDWQSKK